MKKGFNYKNGKKAFANNQNKRRNGQKGGVTVQRIDIDSIYRKLKAALDRRSKLQDEYDRLWAVIKRNNVDRHAELKRVDTAIGKETHELNKLVSQLCQYRKTHRAMNLAYDSIGREMTRTQRIIEKWQRTISEVERGKISLINSRGVTHTNTANVRNYVAHKQQQLNKLRAWQNHVARYRVA